jgi:uncharacterized membrane protein
MKHWPVMLGVVLVVVGGWIHFYPPSMPTEHQLLKVGEWRATVEGKEPIAPWIGPFIGGVGCGLLLYGVLRRRS